ncbi:hypothetical protein R3P38DRAFT_3164521 [Favolaschia claudopus]|uniref:Uncharacterized protein n=1 Tax=Favolaschia claudopus TaxID=2862362 RepID=A0AAW0EHI1_9AGAR
MGLQIRVLRRKNAFVGARSSPENVRVGITTGEAVVNALSTALEEGMQHIPPFCHTLHSRLVPFDGHAPSNPWGAPCYSSRHPLHFVRGLGEAWQDFQSRMRAFHVGPSPCFILRSAARINLWFASHFLPQALKTVALSALHHRTRGIPFPIALGAAQAMDAIVSLHLTDVYTVHHVSSSSPTLAISPLKYRRVLRIHAVDLLSPSDA